MYHLRIQTTNEMIEVSATFGENLLGVLKKTHIKINTPCMGGGQCKKCKIELLEGSIKGTLLSECGIEKKSQRYEHRVPRYLACQSEIIADATIRLVQEEEHQNKSVEVLTEYQRVEVEKKKGQSKKQEYGIGIDLGTTTVVCQLIRPSDDTVIQTYQCFNPQVIYGADVVSRITAAKDKKNADAMRKLILDRLSHGMFILLSNAGISIASVGNIVIAGNTTMLHLLLGYCMEGLQAYPFCPFSLCQERRSLKELFERVDTTMWLQEEQEKENVKVDILPGISAFVGADVISGLYLCEVASKSELCLFVDLGTNGEIALGNKEKIITTATAAGPAFEGGNLSGGIGSIAGAISEVSLNKYYTNYRTIKNEPPIGICGTGAIELVSELLRTKKMDQTGQFVEPYRTNGFFLAGDKTSKETNISFIQEDIRQVQLAKAAIRAGIEVLMKKFEVTGNEISRVYLAGGMGFYLDIKKAVNVGLIPKELEHKVTIVGNSSLGGCVKYLSDATGEMQLEKIRQGTTYINLANEGEFEAMFLKYIDFN